MIPFTQSAFALQRKGMVINCTHTSKPPSSETADGVTVMELCLVKICECSVRTGKVISVISGSCRNSSDGGGGGNTGLGLPKNKPKYMTTAKYLPPQP